MKESEKNKQFISVIIACRNEEEFIGRCLDSIIANDYPKNSLEVLIVDGVSEDGTKEIANKYARGNSFIKIFDNPKKIAPVAQNIGVKNAKGEVIMIMDAHSTYEKDYISNCVEYLNKYNADCVGGIWRILPRNGSLSAQALALVASHPFGAGNAYYKIGFSGQPRWVDTVPYGCFKKEVFKKIGLWNEKFVRSYDMDFHSRLREKGGKILLVSKIVIYYYIRSNFKDSWKHNFLDGIWVTYPLKFHVKTFSWRHFMPLFFVLGLIGSVILSLFSPIFLWLFLLIISLYFLVNMYCSFKISMKEKNSRLFFVMPLAFATRHIGYGLGSVWGLIKLII